MLWFHQLFFCSAGSRKEGTGGREVKTKAVKKKGRGRDADENSDEENNPGGGSGNNNAVGSGHLHDVSFMNAKEIQAVLQKQKELKECPQDLLIEIASQLHRWAHFTFCRVIKE